LTRLPVGPPESDETDDDVSDCEKEAGKCLATRSMSVRGVAARSRLSPWHTIWR
jgi:hypothetical protein